MWAISKVCIEFFTILLLFYVLFCFGPEACGILALQPGIEPATPTLEGKVLTTGPPGKSLACHLFKALSAETELVINLCKLYHVYLQIYNCFCLYSCAFILN